MHNNVECAENFYFLRFTLKVVLFVIVVGYGWLLTLIGMLIVGLCLDAQVVAMYCQTSVQRVQIAMFDMYSNKNLVTTP